MKIISLFFVVLALFISGCASVPIVQTPDTSKAKEFSPPSEGMAGVYLYRKSGVIGQALKKDLWIDGKCVGETAPGVFFYAEVAGDQEHTIDTESEFSPNSLKIFFEAGKNYFIRQVIKMGFFVGGAKLEQISEEQGKIDVSFLPMAQPGKCSGN
ncbi:MAG: DUF2846 domain-containing protein [Deltaproteobacteria bacterium]|jgi:hypothetical protein|nr:DUF2846 domain-containing protein [Deltaproteobacteria bacterium]